MFGVQRFYYPASPTNFSVASLPTALARRQWVDLRSGISEVDRYLSDFVSAEEAPSPDAMPTATPSVQSAVASLTGDVTATHLVTELLRAHPEYGDGRGAAVKLNIHSGDRATAQAWLERVRALLNPGAVTELHGRLLIVALARLDDEARRQLRQLEADGLLAAVEREISEPLAVIFAAAPAPPEETVPTHSDNPARIDELNREGFARILARRIRDTRVREEEAASATHDEDSPLGRSF